LYGDQKWVSIAIQEMLIVGWQLKLGFDPHPKNFDRWMTIENGFQSPSELT